MESLIEYLANLGPIAAITGIVVIIAGVLRWTGKVDAKFENIDSRFDRVDKDINKRFEDVDKRFDKVDKDIRDLKSDVKNDIKDLSAKIDNFILKMLELSKNTDSAPPNFSSKSEKKTNKTAPSR